MTGQRRLLVAAAVAATSVLAACGSDVPANDAEVGQCTNQDLTRLVGEIDSVDCAEPHTAEVYAIFDIDDDDFPGADAISDLAVDGCNGDRFEDYVGLPYEVSEIYSATLAPTEQTWNDADDRTVICLAGAQDGSPSEGSVEGANR